MALPATANLTAYRGDSWAQTFRFLEDDQPVDLNDTTVASWARPKTGTAALPLLTTIGPDPGTVTLALPTEIQPGTYAYDVEITDATGTVTTWVRGDLRIDRDVTNVP
jgi:hypothetical protein